MDYQIFRYLGLPIRIKVKIFTYLYLYYRDDVAYLCPIRVEWEIKIKDPYFETRLEWLLSTIEGELGRLNTVDLRGEIGTDPSTLTPTDMLERSWAYIEEVNSDMYLVWD